MAPSRGAIPKLQPSSAGDASVTNSSKFTIVYPIPAGFTVKSFRLIGGDAQSAAADERGHRHVVHDLQHRVVRGAGYHRATSSSNSQPYIVTALPSAVTVLGGRQMTMPTLEVTLQATGTSGTVGNFKMTEVINTTVAVLIITTTANFDGYPTNPSNPGVTPPVAEPVTLASTTIN